jgi:Uncharacterised protein family (UPF0014)
MYLAFGASRLEACRPVAKGALLMALTPVVNQMRCIIPSYTLFLANIGISFSVIGIIAIPGMMTGAILGGSSVQQAAMLQMIITFMISSATTLASIFTTIAVIAVGVDSQHRIRPDRIHEGMHGVWKARERGGLTLIRWLRSLFCLGNADVKEPNGVHERTHLLHHN